MTNLQTIWPKLQQVGVLWVPGMLDTDGDRVLRVLDSGDLALGDCLAAPGDMGDPDLDDLPTVYALLGVLRRVSEDPGAYVRPEPFIGDNPDAWVAIFESPIVDDDGWERGPDEAEGPTEGEAVIMALCAVLGVTP